MDQRECVGAIAAGLGDLGITGGDTVLVHSAFKSLWQVPGGIETVIEGFLQALGSDGTLLMPALSWSLRPPEIFDIRLTPCNVGAIAEYFRLRPGTRRSMHPTHSVCAVGRRTHELLGGHSQDSTPCGPHSPFRKIADSHGQIVMLGCGLKPNTTMHALEECVGPPYLFGQSHVFTLRDECDRSYRKAYRTHGFTGHGYIQRYDRLAELDCRSCLARGPVWGADTCVLDAPALKRVVVEKLKEDPCFFVDLLPVPDSGGPQ